MAGDPAGSGIVSLVIAFLKPAKLLVPCLGQAFPMGSLVEKVTTGKLCGTLSQM